MITNKQKQRDFEYEADYQSKSRYTAEQWANILKSGQIGETDLNLLKEIYSSFNHAANVLQLGFSNNLTEEEVIDRMNAMGQLLGEANDFKPDTDFSGQEYWWYLFCWGKNLEEGILELKLHPELSEGIGQVFPELEESYYAFAGDVERSMQIRYSQEHAVWIAASILLYEKYYRYPGINTDDILLMQYELQTRAQKIFGQDVNANTISLYCNADERGHRFNYLRDIYKYYRVSFPGEFDGDRERPEPEEMDYNAYIYSIFGYMTIASLQDFLEHEYAHLVDESYVELEGANGFVRLAAFLTRQGGKILSSQDTSDKAAELRANGADGAETFHLIAEALIQEYPNFIYARKAGWFIEETETIAPVLCDQLIIDRFEGIGASVGICTLAEGDALHLETSLNLPVIDNEEVMADIRDKCDKLSLMTAAPFVVENLPADSLDLVSTDQKIKASAVYKYDDYKTMKEEDIVGLLAVSLEIFASWYTDLCQNYYPAPDGTDPVDPLAEALGSKLVYRQGAEAKDLNIVYKEGASNPSTDYITKALQSYGTDAGSQGSEGSEASAGTATVGQAGGEDPEDVSFVSRKREIPEDEDDIPVKKMVSLPASSHADRSDQSSRLYPKNLLIKGPMKTAKFHEALMTAVGIIEGKDRGTLSIEAVPDILEHFKEYVEENRIMHLSYPDIDGKGYESFIEDARGQNGIFKEFANHCGAGRYVVLMEDVDVSWMHLFGDTTVLLRENRREGASSETVITLKYSHEPFRLPANLYIVATCDAQVSEDTILGAINHDFYIRPVNPDPRVLHSMRVEGISLERLMTTINMRISYFLGPDYQLGEGFYLSSPERDAFRSLARMFREQIIPILERWFDNDVERIRYVLGDNGKTRPDTIFYRATPFRDNLFRGDIPDDFDRERIIYQLNEDAFLNPRSYITVYE